MIAGEKLYIDEVMCLQMAGMSTPEIMRVNFMAFNRLRDASTLLRFSLINPEFYPNDYQCPFMIPLTSLSVLNAYVSQHYQELTNKWNALRPDFPAIPDYLPNYRAINRLKN